MILLAELGTACLAAHLPRDEIDACRKVADRECFTGVERAEVLSVARIDMGCETKLFGMFCAEMQLLQDGVVGEGVGIGFRHIGDGCFGSVVRNWLCFCETPQAVTTRCIRCIGGVTEDGGAVG